MEHSHWGATFGCKASRPSEAARQLLAYNSFLSRPVDADHLGSIKGHSGNAIDWAWA